MLNNQQERSRSAVSKGNFDTSQSFSLSIQTDRDCDVKVFYVLPDGLEGLPTQENCLLVFPNEIEKNGLVSRSVRRVLLNRPAGALPPVVSGGEVAYLYVLATAKKWGVRPDRRFGAFAAFSPAAALALANQITDQVEEANTIEDEPKNLVAEE